MSSFFGLGTGLFCFSISCISFCSITAETFAFAFGGVILSPGLDEFSFLAGLVTGFLGADLEIKRDCERRKNLALLLL